jgi:hypothetical protein
MNTALLTNGKFLRVARHVFCIAVCLCCVGGHLTKTLRNYYQLRPISPWIGRGRNSRGDHSCPLPFRTGYANSRIAKNTDLTSGGGAIQRVRYMSTMGNHNSLQIPTLGAAAGQRFFHAPGCVGPVSVFVLLLLGPLTLNGWQSRPAESLAGRQCVSLMTAVTAKRSRAVWHRGIV